MADRRATPLQATAALAMRATSSASASESGGRIEGSRVAAIDFPPRAARPSAGCGRRRRQPQAHGAALECREDRRGRAHLAGTSKRGRGEGALRVGTLAAANRRSAVRDGPARSPRYRRRGPPRRRWRREQRSPSALLASRLGQRQDTSYRAHRAVQRQLSDQAGGRAVLQAAALRRHSRRDGDREVHARAGLAQACRRQVGDDPPQRELKASC